MEVECISTELPLQDSPPTELRQFSGYVVGFRRVGMEGRYYRYEATMRPWLAMLAYNQDYRVFNQKTVPQILEVIFGLNAKFGRVKLNLRNKPYRVWSYCVQYQESDLNFVRRLMQQEGIYHYYEHSGGEAVLVLVDDPSCHASKGGCSQIWLFDEDQPGRARHEYFSGFGASHRVRAGKFSYDGFDFKKPKGECQEFCV